MQRRPADDKKIKKSKSAANGVIKARILQG
jgi:hypothetical protein